ALGGSRFASRLFHEFGKEATGGLVKKLAIIGAGDYGERLLREIRSTQGKTVTVVCFVDDDRDKEGLTVQGVPITGPISELEDICKRYEVESVAIGIRALPGKKLRAIVRATGRAGAVIEYGYGSYTLETEPSVLLFERLNRGLDRAMPTTLAETASAFYRGKRILLTHGGGALGPGLAGELAGCGGSIAVHTTSRRDVHRFSGVNGGDIEYFVSNIDREIDVVRLLDAAQPDVVIHSIPLDAEGLTNASEYLWRRTVRTCSALCRALPKHGLESVTFVLFRNTARLSTRANGLGAVCEALVLNDPDLRPACPKVIRLPAVLTGEELRRIWVSSRADTHAFELTEPEAAALVLNTTAIQKARTIVIPREASTVAPGDIAAFLSRGTWNSSSS
ncbi:MAG: hypothetical protein P8181_08065, partial [bacterium]